ncbi:hypothetical protein Cgig2_023981 [Carnegiea gigantea]|uniref:Endonuclease/exonuclease/phosphatase domain-containing protein n=1 Tax=Carnegiea gigantea TaxID=171969 RepID=A0A9Q1KA14_9CARY|nr:hypothetical protein Cgig2_023981 [Carnegiea gigantea]
METILVQLGDYHGAFVDARGRSGGLALLWDKNLELIVVSYSSHHIDATLKWHNQDPLWWFTGAGGPLRAQAHIDAFRDAFLDNDLHDLGFSGYEFTWCNKRVGAEVVEERLDRFCASTERSIQFPEARVQHIDSYISDHLPILLRCKPRNWEAT